MFPPADIVLAHGGMPHSWRDLLSAWGLSDPVVLVALPLSAWLYARGVRRLWKSSGPGTAIKRWEAACFIAGWLWLFVALVSPIHPWGRVLFSVHMTQHEILMLLGAPLLVLGKPLVAFLLALPPRGARALAQWGNRPGWRRIWSSISAPFGAFAIHAVALWVWHIPSWFEATIHSEWVHAVQHSSFFFTAVLFWWALMHGRRAALNYGLAVLYLFLTALHSGFLGALLTFTRRTWYPAYTHTTQSWGLTPLEDQQLGGLIMWIPAGAIYIFAALVLFVGWMRESERRVLDQEARHLAAACLLGVMLLCLGSTGCDKEDPGPAVRATGGDPMKGQAAIQRVGCSSCHTIPGIAGANALVGPPLDHLSQRTYIAGRLTNTPNNLIQWLKNPRHVDEKTAMPNLHLSDSEARDIAAYLYTIK